MDFERYVSYTTLTLNKFSEAIPNYDPYIKFERQNGCLSNTYFVHRFFESSSEHRAYNFVKRFRMLRQLRWNCPTAVHFHRPGSRYVKQCLHLEGLHAHACMI